MTIPFHAAAVVLPAFVERVYIARMILLFTFNVLLEPVPMFIPRTAAEVKLPATLMFEIILLLTVRSLVVNPLIPTNAPFVLVKILLVSAKSPMVLLVTIATPGFTAVIPVCKLVFAVFIIRMLRMILLVTVVPVMDPPDARIPVNAIELVINQRLPAVVGACGKLPPIKFPLMILLFEFEFVDGLKSIQMIALVDVVVAVS